MRVTLFLRSCGIFFALPLLWADRLSAATTVTFAQNVGGYSGVVDTTIVDSSVTVGGGDYPFYNFDNNQPGDAIPVLLSGENRQVLIRFDNVFGAGPGQIPLGAQIDSATLTLGSAEPDDSSAQSAASQGIYRMLVAWSNTVTWNSFVNGISTNNIEAAPLFDSSPAAINTTTTFDVLPSLSAWASGTPNYGWVLFSGSSDDAQFASSEVTGSEIPARGPDPLLSVTYTVPEPSLGVGVIAVAVWRATRRRGTRQRGPVGD